MAHPVRTGIDRERVHAICFDIDGTLADTDNAYIDRLVRWLKPVRWMIHGGEVQVAARRLVLALETPANAFVAGMDRIGLDQVIGPITDFLYRLRGARPARGMRLIAGTHEMLQSLSAHYPLAIATARERHSALGFLKEYHLAPFFTCVATARSARRAKPHPAPILWVCEQLSIDPANLLMVGDTVGDIRSAHAAGAQTAGVLCGFGEREELERAGADEIFQTTADIPAALL
jgi:HAD superfamily hydrolase (TIGR01509 family)